MHDEGYYIASCGVAQWDCGGTVRVTTQYLQEGIGVAPDCSNAYAGIMRHLDELEVALGEAIPTKAFYFYLATRDSDELRFSAFYRTL